MTNTNNTPRPTSSEEQDRIMAAACPGSVSAFFADRDVARAETETETDDDETARRLAATDPGYAAALADDAEADEADDAEAIERAAEAETLRPTSSEEQDRDAADEAAAKSPRAWAVARFGEEDVRDAEQQVAGDPEAEARQVEWWRAGMALDAEAETLRRKARVRALAWAETERADRDAARAEVATLRAERDEARAEVERLREQA